MQIGCQRDVCQVVLLFLCGLTGSDHMTSQKAPSCGISCALAIVRI